MPGATRSNHKTSSARSERRAEREAASAPVSSDREDLVHLGPSRLEVQGAGGRVQPPDPRPCRADLGDGLLPVRLEVGHPRPERQRVVLPQGMRRVPDESRSVRGG